VAEEADTKDDTEKLEEVVTVADDAEEKEKTSKS
jgi:hypothetical protein